MSLVAEPIKAMINEEPSFRYRTVAAQLGFNKNTTQRVFQLRGDDKGKNRPANTAGPNAAHVSRPALIWRRCYGG